MTRLMLRFAFAASFLVACGITERHVQEQGAGAATGSGGSAGVTAGGAPMAVEQGTVVTGPADVVGFGSSLATGKRGQGSRLWVGGTPQVSTFAAFDLSPSGSRVDVQLAPTEPIDPHMTFLTDSPASVSPSQGLGSLADGFSDPCFAMGIELDAVRIECGGLGLRLQPPDSLQPLLEFSFDNAQPTSVSYASQGEPGRDLLLTAREERFGWYYPTLDAPPFEISLPLDVSPDRITPRTVAIVQSSGPRFLLFGLPSFGKVLMYWASPEGPRYQGCLQGGPGFGKAITAGQLLSAMYPPSLVIGADNGVTVIGGKIGGLDPEGPCREPTQVQATLTCNSNGDPIDCGQSEFGAALAVGDLDGDGRDELVVGAPNLGVAAAQGAGGVFVFDIDAPGSYTSSLRTWTTPLAGSRLGHSLALPAVGQRRWIAAGAPGANRVVLLE
jgi:hypothetical protein